MQNPCDTGFTSNYISIHLDELIGLFRKQEKPAIYIEEIHTSCFISFIRQRLAKSAKTIIQTEHSNKVTKHHLLEHPWSQLETYVPATAMAESPASRLHVGVIFHEPIFKV